MNSEADENQHATLMKRFVSAHRLHAPPSLRISAQVFSALAELPCSLLSWAILLSAFSPPPKFIKRGVVTRFITDGDINSLSSKLKKKKISNVEKSRAQNAHDASADPDPAVFEEKLLRRALPLKSCSSNSIVGCHLLG